MPDTISLCVNHSFVVPSSKMSMKLNNASKSRRRRRGKLKMFEKSSPNECLNKYQLLIR